MAMGIVSDSDFDSELSNLNPNSKKKESVKINDIVKGRGKNNVGVPNELRQIIGETSKIEGRQAGIELANNFGISPSSVSAYANGSTSTATYNEQPNLPHINDAKDRVSKKARNTLLRAIKHITDDKLAEAKAVEIASVAKSMSSVIKDMEPDVPRIQQNNGPTFVMYRPEFKREETFDTIQVKE